jgi:hypothetical protein
MMSDPEVRIKCMEFAAAQWRIENCLGGLKKLAELQDWFYSRIVIEPLALGTGKNRKSEVDKAPEIFK